MPRLLPMQSGMTEETSGKGKEPRHRHTALWPKALKLAGKCECWGEGVFLHPLARDAGGEGSPSCHPGSEHPSSCAGSPAAAKAEREFADEPFRIRALGVRCCWGCHPPGHVSLAGKLGRNWESDSPGTSGRAASFRVQD